MRPESVDTQPKRAKSLFKCPANLCVFQSTSKVKVKKHFDDSTFCPVIGIKIDKKVKSQFKQENNPLLLSQKASYVCRFCSQLASDMLELKHHLMGHLDAGEVTKEDLRSDLGHSIFFSEKQPRKASFSNFKCARCDFRTKFEDDVKEHFETQHNNPGTLDEAA